MAFVTRKAPALLLAAVTSLGLLVPHAAEARNGQNAALIIGALLGAAAGSTLAHSAEYDDNYTVVEQAPRPIYRQRFVDPGYDEAGFDEPSRPVYREAPRYRVVRDGWDRGGYDGERGFHRQPCPERDWRRAGDGW
ncbi:hypothetical protein [Lichenifustis flavocetrariae]|uniref:Uncharacterized protein n=1 Tax=Lichenifustis flavocetrariae TaxID=2949735 RepID=A0AA41YYY0_9HYPH|nr:hypothetical protein [Lichenifustis flavocetrariae]MCW6507390.1 hypothetical protein [Lichenifustis flavocetrariae]